MTQAPWDYLLQQWGPDLFPDIFWPFTIAVIVFFVGQIVVYNVRTRRSTSSSRSWACRSGCSGRAS